MRLVSELTLDWCMRFKSALPQRGGEVNLTLGGIDLNNSGSVVVREDKKLLTVLFPDGRDGRAFTLKAESSEDLFEWKTALEHALAQAPSAALVMGHGIFRNDTNDAIEGSFNQWRDKRPVKSMVVGRPILLALEDIDGGPSFLEKALQFLEKFGINVEGILRQSADVEEVARRVQEYEQGKTEFGSEEDAHIVGDCVKHVLRELPSSPVPASCCTALLEACKIDRRDARISAMRSAILETFPEPNRRLLHRILKMMHTISLHASENRMTPSAVAACMAPLLLRPLLAGECELEDDLDMNGDNSVQLLAAANAANNAQAIITTLLEEYENIFKDDNLHRCSISADFQIENSGSEDSTDDENLDMKHNGYHDAENEVDPETDDDPERILSGKLSESSSYGGSDLYDYKWILHGFGFVVQDGFLRHGKSSHTRKGDKCLFNGRAAKCEFAKKKSGLSETPLPRASKGGGGILWVIMRDGGVVVGEHGSLGLSFANSTLPFTLILDSSLHGVFAVTMQPFGGNDSNGGSPRDCNLLGANSNSLLDSQTLGDPNIQSADQLARQRRICQITTNEMEPPSTTSPGESQRSMGEILSAMDPGRGLPASGSESSSEKPLNKLTGSSLNVKRSVLWGKSTARKTPSMESMDSSGEEELAIQRLEITKNDLRHRIAKEARGNAILQASLERRKQALHERRLALEQDVSRLQEQLQAERDLRAALEVGLSMSSGQFSSSRVFVSVINYNTKTRAELEEIALAEADVARLKQKVAELHHQLNQQRQQHYGSLSDACDQYQHVQNHNSQPKFLQQDFDTNLAYCNHERKQRTEESFLGSEWRNARCHIVASGNSGRHSRKQPLESTSLGDSKSTEASTNMLMDDLCGVDSTSVPSTSRVAEMIDYAKYPSAASSTLVELTTRLDFFKERRSQLMEQLHNLDLNYGTPSQEFIYKPSSPQWS
ncbi:Ternary complex factor MIP1, leucine-zipper [Dillenia turbinata]|uniref:Ternary complex factor MIP1, leucine-zipper n=1 Tax=Dillenia turbinata TaxID=194707 RepID=A0AAN8UYT0_9MAGN